MFIIPPSVLFMRLVRQGKDAQVQVKLPGILNMDVYDFNGISVAQYEFCAAMCHFPGHWYAIRKTESGSWYFISDGTVEKLTEELKEKAEKEAMILLYQIKSLRPNFKDAGVQTDNPEIEPQIEFHVGVQPAEYVPADEEREERKSIGGCHTRKEKVSFNNVIKPADAKAEVWKSTFRLFSLLLIPICSWCFSSTGGETEEGTSINLNTVTLARNVKISRLLKIHLEKNVLHCREHRRPKVALQFLVPPSVLLLRLVRDGQNAVQVEFEDSILMEVFDGHDAVPVQYNFVSAMCYYPKHWYTIRRSENGKWLAMSDAMVSELTEATKARAEKEAMMLFFQRSSKATDGKFKDVAVQTDEKQEEPQPMPSS
ncbi:uncharacterized protein LOC132195291 [Neocloeon triangulifer]|uniref:uncharacterized protein LOC132195291 n=1 Tax=Neocloeon triangulifer TaxID=2078957 RepID=UPI00286F67B0|nr:uncharacterized protein LOC132195291 [Neocloeon triangulifer]XP_059473176.1 uncharacterized protein LOC132195291 [Neocloeon triangulifer]XP_059473177.1 uncharacterized protein LOC132195291 [Neocloeon triangulifer]